MNGKLLLAAFLTLASTAPAQSIIGRWDATVTVNGVDIPCRFELGGSGASIAGSFFNGDERLTSTSGHFENGSLALSWDYFASRLDASLKDGVLEGSYTQARRAEKAVYVFRAKRYEARKPGPGAPDIGGLWTIPNKSPKGELAWRFIVHQHAGDISASILRVDGDTGALTGSYRDGKFVLSHFSGTRPMLLEVSVAKDGSLEMLENGKTKFTAVRAEQASAKGVPEPTDPDHHTSVKDPREAFRFSFPDLNGRMVTNGDARFQGKVVLVNITGSWCPNCHDEAPFLEALYKKYRTEGLEIVALSFEEADQLKDPARLRAFIKKYGIEYTVLLGGQPDEAQDKLTQAVNWNSWPTTFFLGRDGHVRLVHAGFPSAASGELYRSAKEEFTSEVEQLLRENMRTAR